MDSHKKEVAKLILAHCGKWCDIWMMSGPSNAKTRTRLLRFIANNDKIPSAKCGVNAMNDALISLYDVKDWDCIRDRDKRLQAEIIKASE